MVGHVVLFLVRGRLQADDAVTNNGPLAGESGLMIGSVPTPVALAEGLSLPGAPVAEPEPAQGQQEQKLQVEETQHHPHTVPLPFAPQGGFFIDPQHIPVRQAGWG